MSTQNGRPVSCDFCPDGRRLPGKGHFSGLCVHQGTKPHKIVDMTKISQFCPLRRSWHKPELRHHGKVTAITRDDWRNPEDADFNADCWPWS